jgi:hypothetical protein
MESGLQGCGRLLANISFDKVCGLFSYDNLAYDSEIDVLKYCQQAEELFELYQRCANRRRELDGLDDEFNTLKFLSQELSVRAQTLRFRKAA